MEFRIKLITYYVQTRKELHIIYIFPKKTLKFTTVYHARVARVFSSLKGQFSLKITFKLMQIFAMPIDVGQYRHIAN